MRTSAPFLPGSPPWFDEHSHPFDNPRRWQSTNTGRIVPVSGWAGLAHWHFRGSPVWLGSASITAADGPAGGFGRTAVAGKFLIVSAAKRRSLNSKASSKDARGNLDHLSQREDGTDWSRDVFADEITGMNFVSRTPCPRTFAGAMRSEFRHRARSETGMPLRPDRQNRSLTHRCPRKRSRIVR